jgi:hypothetical protein
MTRAHGLRPLVQHTLVGLLLLRGSGLSDAAQPTGAPQPQGPAGATSEPGSPGASGPRAALSVAEGDAVDRTARAVEASRPSGTSELTVESVVEGLLARNPSLAQMAAAAQAAAARYPQVTSLEDPMFAGTIGPGTFAPDDAGIHFAYRLELAQKYPWPGKRALRGQNALAEAQAAGNDVDDMRLQLIESAKAAFYEYYLVERGLDVNAEGLGLLAEAQKVCPVRGTRLGSMGPCSNWPLHSTCTPSGRGTLSRTPGCRPARGPCRSARSGGAWRSPPLRWPGPRGCRWRS